MHDLKEKLRADSVIIEKWLAQKYPINLSPQWCIRRTKDFKYKWVKRNKGVIKENSPSLNRTNRAKESGKENKHSTTKASHTEQRSKCFKRVAK